MNDVALSGSELIEHVVKTIAQAAVDFPDKAVLVDCPLIHTFTPGLYSRRILMPADKIIVSEKHKTEHQYVILEGVVSVWTEDQGWLTLCAGHEGITKAGTQRILITAMDTVWKTFHPNPKGFKTADEIYEDIIEKVEMPSIGGRFKNNVFIPSIKELDNTVKLEKCLSH